MTIPLTIAVLDHHIHGYPKECMASLLDADLPDGTEFILVSGRDDVRPEGMERRIVRLERGDRAAAKNVAVAGSRGEFVLLVSADVVAAPQAVRRMLDLLRDRPDAVCSAQMLCENGMERLTAYRFPSILGELNPLRTLRRLVVSAMPTKPPPAGGLRRVEAFRFDFVMARKDVFEKVGRFAEGYRFGYEDVEWCWRARRMGVARWVLRDATAYKLAPQLKGRLPPDVLIAMERSLMQCVMAIRGRTYARLFRAVRMCKALAKLVACAVPNYLLCGRSELLDTTVRHSVAVLTDAETSLPPDIESVIRWEGAAR